MKLTKDGQVISLDNDNHISAFLTSGWEEAKEPSPVQTPKAEEPAKVEDKPKTEAKKPTAKKKQEK